MRRLVDLVRSLLAGDMARGAFFMIAWRWTIRFLGLFSTIVLARILAPQDFGVVAICMILVGLTETLTQTGQDIALIRMKQPTREHYDTAWTVQVLIGLFVFIVLNGLAPFAAIFFMDPRIELIVHVLSLRSLAAAFTNIGIVDWRRDMKFGADFSYLVAQKISAVAITITLALIYANYWALIAGIVTSSVATVIASYWLHPFRPRFGFKHWREIWGFSGWTTLVTISVYLQNKVDEFIVARYFGARAVGFYNVGADIASAPTQELVIPIGRALYSIYSKSLDQLHVLRASYLSVFGMVVTVAAAGGFGVSAVSEEFVLVLLGSQWSEAVPIVRWIAFEGALYGICHGAITVLNVTGKPHWVAIGNLTRVAIIGTACWMAALSGDMVAVAAAKTGVTLLFLPIALGSVARTLEIPATRMILPFIRPLAAGVSMYLVLAVLRDAGFLSGHSAFIRLLGTAAVGGIVYTSVLTGLWVVAGRPDGPERTLLGPVIRRFARRTSGRGD